MPSTGLFDAYFVDFHRILNVFQIFHTQIRNFDIDRSFYNIVDIGRNAYAAGLRQWLDAGNNIHSGSENIIIGHQDVPDERSESAGGIAATGS